MPDTNTDGQAALTDEIRNVPLEDFDLFVNQAREQFGEAPLRQLADDLLANGQLQPGVAWLDPGRNRLVLVCGERRYRALKLAGLPTMAVKVLRGNLTQGRMLQMNLAENLQRASLNPIERAKGFQRLMQLEGLNASEVASRMNVSNATVSNALALLELSEPLQARVASGVLPAKVGVHIARVADADVRRALADRYEGGLLTQQGVADETRRLKESGRGKKGGKPPRLSLKLSGLSVSVTGKPERWTLDNLLAVVGRIGKEAKSLKDAGKTDVAELAAVLKAS
jgi:ParB family chromosome partitioning protein